MVSILYLNGCDSSVKSTERSATITNNEPKNEPSLYIFNRNAKLLDRNLKVVGCANKNVIVKAVGWLPYPKGTDGKALKDPDDGTIMSALYEISFSEDHFCSDNGVVLKDKHYWVSPAALTPYQSVIPAHVPKVESVELYGNGCPDHSSYSFAGTLDGSNLSILFNRFSLKASSTLKQQADCKISIKIKVPKEGLIKRFTYATRYSPLFGKGTNGRLDSRTYLNGNEIDHQKKEGLGPLEVSETLSNDQEPPKLGFCKGIVEFLIEQKIELTSSINKDDDSFEFIVDSTDYVLNIVPCP
jgi:hypothetical protein